MKIALIHLGFFYAGGGERLVLEETRGLRRLGHEVECFAPIVDPEVCYPELIREVGVRSFLPRPPSWLPGRVALAVLAACVLAPLLALRFRRFDVLLAANQPSAWIAWVISRILNKRYVAYLAFPNRVLYPRPVDRDVNRPNLDYRIFALTARLARPLVAWADRVSVAGASAVLANGTYIAGVLERVYKRSMISCPAGSYPVAEAEIDFQRRTQGELRLGDLRIPKPFVLLTNRHYPQKRFDYAVRAMTAVPRATLVITGARTSYTGSVQALARQLGVEDRVIFSGLVSETDLARLYANAAAYVYPAPEEDYGMGIPEAMAHGVPTVAWRSAGPTGTVVDNESGFLVDPFDETAFALSIGRLVNDLALAERMGRGGWLHVMNGLSYMSHFRSLEQHLQRAAEAAAHRSRPRFLRLALQSGLGLVFLALWARTMPVADLWQHARPRHLLPLALIVMLGPVSGLLRARRWGLLLRPLVRVGTAEAFWINAGGSLLNYLVPLRAGDAARVLWLNRRHRVLAGSALATILIDKGCDLAAVAAVLGLAALGAGSIAAVGRTEAVGLGAASLAGGLLLTAVLAIAVAGPRIARSWPLTRVLPPRWSAEVAEQAFSFRGAATACLNRSRLPLVGALSLSALFVDGLAFSLLFRALDIAVTVPAAIVAYVALLLSYLLPAAPGYVGTLEFVGSLVLTTALGLPKAAAAGAIVLWHALGSAMILAFGIPALYRLHRRPERREHQRRIAVFHCGFTYSGGGERIVLEEVLGLRRLGYQVECYAPTVDLRACYPDLIRAVGVRTFLPQLPAWVPLRDALHMVASSVLVPLYAWRFRSFDAIVGANQPGAWIAWWVTRLLGKPHLVYLNQPNRLVYPRAIDLETGWQTRPDYHLLNAVIQRIRGFVAWADRRSITEAATLLVNGRYIGDIIRKTYARPAEDCPAGCHVEDGYPLPLDQRFTGRLTLNGVEIRKPYVLLTNRHDPQKRFDLVIRALAKVHRAHPDIQLVIPGPKTSHTEELISLVASLGLTETVLFLGVISELDLQRLYAQAAVYVYPAPEEDFGMGVIESMAKGVPVVAWNQAGPTVTVTQGETGYLATPGDVEDYARGIAAYLADPARNQETGRRAHARARLFSWERHVAVLHAAIVSALEARVHRCEVAPPTETEKPPRASVEPVVAPEGRAA